MVLSMRARSGLLAVLVLALAGWATVTQAESDAFEAIKPPIDINAASAEELTRLPGIGETTARRIVEFREEHGPFRRVEDLMRVKGIGEKSFQKLRPSITVKKAR